ncbi:large neutral amino acids transporter small subunit 2-like isoform X2 [Pomacea canaliculata]|uniref:large neutral amino acids transporter small subunit 2-like isoform X2 n=1 Tax=Pomacea canaliculata TaxID=400727 RepID=UPI000D736AF3|nr:large neutral amino acids transporter small subunit 2-like isoform X2 [Pomacea canaliculata]
MWTAQRHVASVHPASEHVSTGPKHGRADVKDTWTSPPSGTSVRVELRKALSLKEAVVVLVGNIGGTSIFIGATSIQALTGSAGLAVVMWLVGGVNMMLMAFSVCELALLLPQAGGPYSYTKFVFGNTAAFVVLMGFVTFVGCPAWALGAYTAALYLLTLVTPCSPPDLAVKLVAASLLFALVWVNCTYTKYVTRLQVVFTMAKFIAMVIIIVAGFTTVSQGSSHENIQHLMDDTSTCFGSIALSLFASNFAYAGWQVIAMLIEEMHDPARDVPRAVAYSFLIVILMFVSTSFSYYIVLSPAEVMHSDAVAMTLGQYVHPVLPYMLALTVALCSIGTVNVTIMGQSRILYAAARNGHMPRLLAMLHTKYLMPWPAIITALLGALVMLMSGSVMTMIQYVSLFFSIMMLVLLLALIYLRCVGATSPFTHTTFKMPIVVVVFQVALMLALIVVSVAEKPNELGFCIMLLACTIPIYLVCIRWSNKPQAFVNLMDHLTTFIQKLLQLELSSSFTGQQKV